MALILSSPLTRALTTASEIAKECKKSVRISEGLAEYDLGELEGASDPQAWRLNDELYQAWLLDGDLSRSHPGGEDAVSVISRIGVAIELAYARTPAYSTAVLVGHGGAFRLAVPHIAKNVTPRFAYATSLPNAAFIELVHGHDAWTCVRWGPRPAPFD